MATAPVTVNANLNFNPASLNAAGKQVQSAFGNINIPTKQVNAFNNSLGRITGQASEFDKSINAATARVFAFGAAVSIINGISTAFKALISSTIEVEKRLTEIGSILGGTSEELNQFKNAIFDVAKNTGQAFATVADGASELARQGLSAQETVKRLNAALILTRVSGLDAEGSVNALTSAINGFTSAGLTAEQIVNKLVAVDTAFAVSARDLAEAFSRAGSTAEDAGVSFDELLGLVTAVQQTTARGGAVIGNALKSIFSRLSRGTVIEDLQALGVEIDASQTGIQKLQALSAAIERISDPTQANAIKELAGGVYQINVVSAALKDLSSETSIFAQASQTAGQASNEAFEKNAQLNQTLAAQLNKLVQGLTELGSKIGELTIAPVIENLLTGANKLLDILNKVFDPEEGNKLIQGFFKGIGAFLAGPGLILVSAAFFKLFQVVAKFAKEGISDLFKIGSEQERIKNIEGGIVALLQQDANLRATLLSSSTSQAQKEQAVINAIKQQNALLAQQQALVNSIASAAAKAGVGGFSPSGGFTKRKGKGMFAAGFKAEEATAMMLGATSNVKAQYGKGTIDGKKFIKNDQEIEITNFAGGRDSAVIPLYGRGFARGFASGFVPNYARLSWDKSKTEKEIAKLNNINNLTDNQKSKLQEYQNHLIYLNNRAKQSERVGSPQNPLPVKAAGYGYFIPNLNYGPEQKPVSATRLKDKWNGFNVNFKTISNPTFAGPKVDGEAEETNEDDELGNKLSNYVMDQIIDQGYLYASRLISPLVARPINKNGIKQRLGKEGNKGLFGAVQGAAGAAFEAAITEVLSIEEGKLKENEGDFDARSIPSNLAELFGVSGLKKADFKVSSSKDSQSSFIKKILNDNPDYYKRLLGIAQETPVTESPTGQQRKKSAAAGFIPNFNSLNKGVPVSQIRAHFDEMGNPVAVTNTRDEPNGLKDAIGREKKGIGAYTENMAARGFIPNFVFGTPQSLGSFQNAINNTTAATQKATQATQTATQATQKATSSTQKSSQATKGFGSIISKGLNSFSKLSGNFGNVASGLSFLVIPALSDFAGSIALDEEALARETQARDKAVKALETEREKGENANKDLISTLEKEIAKREKSISLINAEAQKFAAGTSDVLTSISSFAFIISSISPGLKKFGGFLTKGDGAKFLARPVFGAGAGAGAAAGAGSIAAGGAAAIASTIALALGTAIVSALAGIGIGKLIRDNITKPIMDMFSLLPSDIDLLGAKIEALESEIMGIEGSVSQFQSILKELNNAFLAGYDIIKLTAEGIRSEFEKINDEVGITGFNSQTQRAEDVDRILSSARDAVTQQNLEKTRDPFEKQKIIAERERQRITQSEVERNRETAKGAMIMKSAQEDFLTGISKYLNTPSEEELGRNLVLEEDKLRTSNRIPNVVDLSKSITQTLKDAVTASGSFGTAGILTKNAIETSTVTGQQDISKAFKRLTDASEALKNSSEFNQDLNLKEFLEARDALKPVLQERAKAGGQDEVDNLNELFNNYTKSVTDGVEIQSKAFLKFVADQEQINLDSLVKQKGVLDEFINNFNNTFLQTVQQGASLLAEASRGTNPIQENASRLESAGLGRGMASGETFLARQNALAETMSRIEASGFFENVGTAGDQAGFRSQFAGQILGGQNITALNDALGAQSQQVIKDILSLQTRGAERYGEATTDQQRQSIIKEQEAQRSTIGAASQTAFSEIFKQLREAASLKGDTRLIQDIDKRLATLNDPRASVDQLAAVGNINLEGSKLEDNTQTEFQTALISATGGVQKVIDSLKGLSAEAESDKLGTQIEGVAARLQELQDALKIDVEEDIKLPTIIEELTTSAEAFKPFIKNVETEISRLNEILSKKNTELETLNKKEAELKGIQQETNKLFDLNIKNVSLKLLALINPIARLYDTFNTITTTLELADKRIKALDFTPSVNLDPQ